MGSRLCVVNKHYSQVILCELTSEDIRGGDHPTVLESPVANGARHFHNTHHPTLTAGKRMEKNMLTFMIVGIYLYMLRTDCKPDRFINGPPVYKPVSRFVIRLARF